MTNVTLTPEMEEIVQNQIRTGRYESANDVVRDALRMMDCDHVTGLPKAEIRKLIDEGLESLRQGRSVDGDEFFDALEAEMDAADPGSRK